MAADQTPARASVFQKAAAESRGSTTRMALAAVVMMAAVGIPVGYWYLGQDHTASADEKLPTSKENFSGAALEARAKIPTIPEILPDVKPQETKAQAPETTPAPAPPAVLEETKPTGPDWTAIRARAGTSSIVGKVAVPMLPAMARPSQAMRHIPRGTVMVGFLEGKLATDNLDSRVRVKLVQDFKVGGALVLPAGGEFIGEALQVAQRHQDRIPVHIQSYIYPDKEHEIPITGLLLDPSMNAHLDADDVQHHTAKLIAGTTALALLGAVSGVTASVRADDFGAVAGARTADSLAGLGARNMQSIQDIVPTLVVEPKPVYIFVDQSLDAPTFETYLFEPASGAKGQPTGEAPPPPEFADIAAQMKQLQELSQMMQNLPAPPMHGKLPVQP